ncbi:MAG: 30S ribosomal protein S2 [Planctomycetota bacterium]|nr:MAG: 30S ribosomal protein S2 [Planctomycetota bacterium]
MPIVSIKELLDAGIHFGHKSAKWNPKMAPYIYAKRNKMHILDVRATVKGIIQAYRFIEQAVASGETVLFVGTKKQSKITIEREALRCGMHFIVERWLGGTFTNLHTIRSRIDRLIELEELEASGDINNFSKKMISTYRRERMKIFRNLNGVRNMEKLPGLIVVVDPSFEHIAVAEARKCGIPVVALIDTDSDPDKVDIVIPGNDDAMNSIDIVIQKLADAVILGKDKRGNEQAMKKEGKTDIAPAPKATPEETKPTEEKPEENKETVKSE